MADSWTVTTELQDFRTRSWAFRVGVEPKVRGGVVLFAIAVHRAPAMKIVLFGYHIHFGRLLPKPVITHSLLTPRDA